MLCRDLAALEYKRRVQVLTEKVPISVAIEQLAKFLFAQTKLGKRTAKSCGWESNEFNRALLSWKKEQAEQDNFIPIESVASALAVRFASYGDLQCTSNPAEELPVKTYQLGNVKVPINPECPIERYLEWLGSSMEVAGLSRCAEFTWVRSCERGVCANPNRQRELQNFGVFFSILQSRLSELKPRYVDDSNVWEGAVSEALTEFSLRLLGSNHENWAYPLQEWCRNLIRRIETDTQQIMSKEHMKEFLANILKSVESLSLDKIIKNVKHIILTAYDISSPKNFTFADNTKDLVRCKLEQQLQRDKIRTRLERKVTKYADRDRFAAITSVFCFIRLFAIRRTQNKYRPYYMFPRGAATYLCQENVPPKICAAVLSSEGVPWSSKQVVISKLIQSFGESVSDEDWAVYKSIVKCRIVSTPRPIREESHHKRKESPDPLNNLITVLRANGIPNARDLKALINDTELSDLIFPRQGAKVVSQFCENKSDNINLNCWDKSSLTDVEIARLQDYLIARKRQVEIARELVASKQVVNLNSGKVWVNQTLKAAFRKIRCRLLAVLEKRSRVAVQESEDWNQEIE